MNDRYSRYPVVTICGSMRYYAEMLTTAQRLTANGNIVLMPHVADYVNGAEEDEQKKMLDDMHFAKIDMSDKILVIGAHIEDSTRREIEHAEKTGKLIAFIPT